MKIVKLTADNFMRIKAVEITPQGNTVLITGRNGQGKSSILDSICATLCGKRYAPVKPIRDGEDRAEVVIETENWIVKRTFTAAGGGSVTITNAEGMKASSPQSLLDKVVGNLAFDPMLFITGYDAKKQREVLMNLAKLDFSDIDNGIAEVKQQRSDVRRDKERYEFEAGRISVPEDTADEEISLADLTANLTLALEKNAAQEAVLNQLKDLKNQIDHYSLLVESQDKDILRLEESLQEAKAERSRRIKLREDLLTQDKMKREQMEPFIETDAIKQKIAVLEVTNADVRKKKEKAELLEKTNSKTKEYAFLGKKMKTLEAQKAKRLADAKMPLPGLSVTEDCVVYEGIPLSQVNDAKKLEIGMGIAMAENPELRVIRMRGNDLDDESLKIVSKMAQDKDYQLWIERWLGDESGIIIEDGSVVNPKETLFDA